MSESLSELEIKQSKETFTLDYAVKDLPEKRIGANIKISAAMATFLFKGEDRHTIRTISDDGEFRKCA